MPAPDVGVSGNDSNAEGKPEVLEDRDLGAAIMARTGEGGHWAAGTVGGRKELPSPAFHVVEQTPYEAPGGTRTLRR